MSGRVVKSAFIPHSCCTGWTWKPVTPSMPPSVVLYRGMYGIPPTVQEYPKDTVWECDCGRRWVSEGPRPWDLGPGWRLERRGERRRRLGLRWWQREAK